MIYVGIDPGQHGSLAVMIAANDGSVELSTAPLTKANFLDFIEWQACQNDFCRVCIEKVHAMPKQGAVSMFTFGEGYGWLKGVLDCAKVSYQEIPPQKWKSEYHLNSSRSTSKADKKAKSIETCKQLFPTVSLIPDGRRKEDDNTAESILLAEYARRKL